ncbi:MAG: peptidoglycan editing factor PgeF [Desulfobulbaceae bacterium]|nr:MAG: peptidoglycan editing factor PgeF [Desulfobulbaceae bacterium]
MDLLVQNGLNILFSDRSGGVSSGTFSGMNLSRFVGDSAADVETNRQLLKNKLRTNVLVSSEQIHGDRILLVDDELKQDHEADGYDGLITRQKHIAIMVQLADCQGVLLHDPTTETVAAVHCGWRGNVANILGTSVRQMKIFANSKASDIHAWISPSLGPCCAEFIHYKKELPQEFWQFQTRDHYFDLWQISKWQLNEVGVPESQITLPSACTCCSEHYFSYRRAKKLGDGVTGRHCAAIMLR